MKSPITNKEMKIISEKRILKFRKEEFEVRFHSYLCEVSGEKFTDSDLDEINFNQVYNQYREKNHIPFPEEIISTRKKYGLSAKKMSELLGFGENQYSLYENDEIPSSSNGTTIRLAQDPAVMEKLITDKKEIFTEKEFKKTQKVIEDILEFERENIQNIAVDQFIFGEQKATKYTGYKIPNWEKILNVIVFFSKELSPLKTTLNKLLFYADYFHYKRTGKSITGLSYKAIQYGNVPNNFELIFSKAEKDQFISIDYRQFKNGNPGEIFHNEKDFNTELFTAEELQSLQKVLEKFQTKNREEIVDICHEETSWIENHKEKNLLDYSYAFDLKAL